MATCTENRDHAGPEVFAFCVVEQETNKQEVIWCLSRGNCTVLCISSQWIQKMALWVSEGWHTPPRISTKLREMQQIKQAVRLIDFLSVEGFTKYILPMYRYYRYNLVNVSEQYLRTSLMCSLNTPWSSPRLTDEKLTEKKGSHQSSTGTEYQLQPYEVHWWIH